MADEEETEKEGQEGPVDASLDAGGDEETDAAEDGEQEGGGGLDARKLLLLVVIPLFILAGVGAGLYFTGTLDSLLGSGAGDEQVGEKSRKGDKEADHAAVGAHFIEIPNMTVNLSTPGSQPRYLSLTVQLELKDMEDVHAIEAVMPRIVDQFQTYLRELRVRDLRGSQGIYRLQMELLARVNDAAYPVEVEDVLFQEILIQ